MYEISQHITAKQSKNYRLQSIFKMFICPHSSVRSDWLRNLSKSIIIFFILDNHFVNFHKELSGNCSNKWENLL